MSKPPKISSKPRKLNIRQQAVIQDIVSEVKKGNGLNPTASHRKFYSLKSARISSSNNMRKYDFRQALIEELKKAKVIGTNSKVNQVLKEGLDAVKYTKEGDIAGEDFQARLAYVQEINKITGVYAPERQDKRTLNMNIDLNGEELDKRIEELKGQVM